jgi:hypothetical protein
MRMLSVERLKLWNDEVRASLVGEHSERCHHGEAKKTQNVQTLTSFAQNCQEPSAQKF